MQSSPHRNIPLHCDTCSDSPAGHGKAVLQRDQDAVGGRKEGRKGKFLLLSRSTQEHTLQTFPSPEEWQGSHSNEHKCMPPPSGTLGSESQGPAKVGPQSSQFFDPIWKARAKSSERVAQLIKHKVYFLCALKGQVKSN